MSGKGFYFALAISLMGSAGVAVAQRTPPPAGSVDQRVQRDVKIKKAADDPAEAYLTGQDDVVLLSRRKFFTVQASLSEQLTDNAYLADSGRRHSEIGSYAVIGSAETRLGNRVDISAYAGAFGSRYGVDKALDYDAAVAGVSAGANLHGVDLSLDYSWQTLREGGFGREQLSQRRMSGDIAYPITLAKGRIRITPTLSTERAWANPEAYNSQSATMALPATFAVSNRLFVSAQVSATRRFYPDYFPGLLGVKRRDNQVAWQLSVMRVLPYGLAIRAEINGVTNHSTSDVNRYRANTGVIGISLQKRF